MVDIQHLNESTVDQAAFDWFAELHYDVLHGPDIVPGGARAERANYDDVVLVDRLRAALERLSPTIPIEARDEAFRKVLRIEHANLIQQSFHFHRFLVDGVSVEYSREDGSIAGDRVKLIEFDDLAHLPSQGFANSLIRRSQ